MSECIFSRTIFNSDECKTFLSDSHGQGISNVLNCVQRVAYKRRFVEEFKKLDIDVSMVSFVYENGALYVCLWEDPIMQWSLTNDDKWGNVICLRR